MRYFLSALLCFICVAKGYGQTGTRSYHTIDVAITKEKKPKRIYTKVVITPPIPWSDSTLVPSLENDLNKKISLKRKVKAGTYTVSVRFLIEKDGSMTDYSCINDPGFGMAEQVIDVMKRRLTHFGPWPASGSKVRPYRTSAITPTANN